MDARQRVRDLAVSGSGFVFDPYTGSTFSVNATGQVILEGLRNELSRDEIEELLRERFEIAAEDVHRDVNDFIGVLRREDILPTDFTM